MTARDEPSVWAIVLAGGQGVRFRPLARYLCGDERPKQFVLVDGTRSLLRQTLDRTWAEIRPDHTLVVTHQAHHDWVAQEFARGARPFILAQPADRGTAAGILLPAHWISWRDPLAVVVVVPCDHFVQGELQFGAHLRAVVDFVRRHPSRLVLLAAHPTHAETQYGWIEPGDSVSAAGSAPIVTIRRFWEKPSEDVARACWVAGGWWNTLVVVATVAALIDTGTRALPELSHGLAELTSRTGGDPAPSEIRETYGPLPAASFSSGVLEACPARLAASPLPPEVTWSDWGTPERVIASLRGAGLTPPWLRALDRWPESIRRAG